MTCWSIQLRIAAFVVCVCIAPNRLLAQGTILATSITLVNPATAAKAQSQYDSTVSVTGTMTILRPAETMPAHSS